MGRRVLHDSGEFIRWRGSPVSGRSISKSLGLQEDPRLWADPLRHVGFRHADQWWMFTDTGTPPRFDTLRLLQSRKRSGSVDRTSSEPIVEGDARLARPAGRVVTTGEGRILRFTQDCSSTYGASVRALEITELTPSSTPRAQIGDGDPMLAGSAVAGMGERCTKSTFTSSEGGGSRAWTVFQPTSDARASRPVGSDGLRSGRNERAAPIITVVACVLRRAPQARGLLAAVLDQIVRPQSALPLPGVRF